jgi:hypothetical protein
MKVAIITGDLIGSSKYGPGQRETAIRTLKQTLEEEREPGAKTVLRYEMYRGDSAQIEVLQVEKALALAILLRAALKKMPYGPKDGDTGAGKHAGKAPAVSGRSYADIRLAVGIGEAAFGQARVVEADGEAYRLSGRTLDAMKKKGQKLIIQSAEETFNQEYEVQCKLLDVIIDKWSTAAAEVVFWLLKGLKDIEIAEHLGISQPAVSFRKKTAGWEAINLMIQGFESKIIKAGWVQV